MGTVYVDTGGNAANSGSTDDTSPITGSAATAAGSVVTLDGSPNLSGLITSGAAQSSINIAGATNANTTIFWITAFDDTLKTVTVSVAPTGVTTNAWRIGGRYLWPSGAGVNVVEGALRAGDIVQFNNSPATKSVTYITARSAGDSTTGFITVRGKSGVRPLLNVTNTAVVITCAQNNWWFENLELDQDGATGNVLSATGNGSVVYNVKITDGGGDGINTIGCTVINCDISGVGGNGYAGTSAGQVLIGNYIHGCGAAGVLLNNAAQSISLTNNIFSGNTGRGVYLSGAATTQSAISFVNNNTFYNNTDSGLEVADADQVVILTNNIFQSTGTPFNVKWAAGTAELHGFHGYNTFYISAGSNNLSGITANATEITTDPLLVNPGSGNFAIDSASPAKATAFPGVFPAGLTTGYLDMGAAQIQATGTTRGQIIGS